MCICCRCILVTLGWPYVLLFSTFQHSPSSVEKDQEERATGIVIAPLWKNQAFWPMLMNMLTARPVPLSAREELLSQPCNKNLKHPLRKNNSATHMQSVRDRFRSQGLSEDATEFIMSSWRESMQQMYDVYIRQWMRYACEKKVDQFSPPLTTAIVCIRAFKSDGSGRACFLKCTLFWSTINS